MGQVKPLGTRSGFTRFGTSGNFPGDNGPHDFACSFGRGFGFSVIAALHGAHGGEAHLGQAA
jgi:hypothetical protein